MLAEGKLAVPCRVEDVASKADLGKQYIPGVRRPLQSLLFSLVEAHPHKVSQLLLDLARQALLQLSLCSSYLRRDRPSLFNIHRYGDHSRKNMSWESVTSVVQCWSHASPCTGAHAQRTKGWPLCYRTQMSQRK